MAEGGGPARDLEVPVPPWLRVLGAIGWRVLASVALAAVLVALAIELATVTLSITLALILTATVLPFSLTLRRRGWSGMATAAVVTIVTALVVILAILVMVLVCVPVIGDVVQAISSGLDAMRVRLADANVSPVVADVLSVIANGAMGWLAGQVAAIAGAVVEAGTIGLLAAFLVFFLVKDGDRAWSWSLQDADDWRRARLSEAGRDTVVRIGRYTRVTAGIATIDAVSVGAFLAILGVPLAGPLGVLVFVGGFVPYVGGAVTATAVLLVALGARGLETAVILFALIAATNLLQRLLPSPMTWRRATGLAPAGVLLALPIGAAIGGLAGLAAAVPALILVLAALPTVVKVLGEPTGDVSVRAGVPVWLDRIGQWSWRLLATLGLIFLGISVAANLPLLVAPVLLGCILAATFFPAARLLRARGWDRTRAAGAVTLATSAGVVAIVAVSVLSLVDGLAGTTQTAVDGASSIGEGSAIPAGDWLGSGAAQLAAGLLSALDLLFGALTSVTFVIVVAVMLTFYLLRDADHLWMRATANLEQWRRVRLDQAVRGAADILGGYMFGTGSLALFNAVTGWVIMTLLGLPYALPVAILSFFGGFIPYIGQFLTSAIGFLIAFRVGSTSDVVIMGIYTVIMNVVQGSFLQPIVYGRAVNLHPAIVLIAIPAGSALAGIAGMFLAVPVLGVIASAWRPVLAVLAAAPPGAGPAVPAPGPEDVAEAAAT